MNKYGKPMAKEAMSLIAKRMNGEIDLLELSDAMFQLDKKYPNCGWDNEAKKVFHDFNQRNGIETPKEMMPK
jgi:hypothetical protein